MKNYTFNGRKFCSDNAGRAVPRITDKAKSLISLNGVHICEDTYNEVIFYNPCSISFSDTDIAKGVLVIGDAGSGKTTSVIMQSGRQLIDRLGSKDKLIILDVKGEYREQLADENSYILGSAHYNTIWNIYSDILAFGSDRYSISQHAGETAKYLLMEQKSPVHPYFTQAAEILMKDIFIYNIRQAQETGSVENLNNFSLNKYLSELSVDDILHLLATYDDFRECSMLLSANPEYGSIGKQGEEVLSELTVMRNRIFQGAFCQKGDFSIAEFIRNGSGTLFLELDMSLFNVLKPIITYFIDVSISAIASHSTDTGRITFLLDEFAMLPKLHNLEMAVALLRSKNCGIICGIQSIDQIYARYNSKDSNIADIIMNIFQSLIIMKSGYSTAKYAQQRFGEREVETPFTTATGGLGVRSERRPAVEINDIIFLETGEAFVKHLNQRAFRFKFSL